MSHETTAHSFDLKRLYLSLPKRWARPMVFLHDMGILDPVHSGAVAALHGMPGGMGWCLLVAPCDQGNNRPLAQTFAAYAALLCEVNGYEVSDLVWFILDTQGYRLVDITTLLTTQPQFEELLEGDLQPNSRSAFLARLDTLLQEVPSELPEVLAELEDGLL